MKSKALWLGAIATVLVVGTVWAADADHSKNSKREQVTSKQEGDKAAMPGQAASEPADTGPIMTDQSASALVAPNQADATEQEVIQQDAHQQASDQPDITKQADPDDVNMFGGPVYRGEPALDVTAALVKAGGGAEKFSFATALVAMLGQDKVNAEVAKLTKQYGKQEVDTFLGGMDMTVNFGLKRATEAGIKLPEPANLSGTELAKTLINAGTAPDSTFWSGHLFDKALSNKIHIQVMTDTNAKASVEADKTTHKILNQAMYDVAQELGMKDVQLADLH